MDTTALSPRRRRLVIAAVLSGLLLAMLDQTIVGTALPRIVADLGGSSLYIWVVTAYLVPATISLPSTRGCPTATAGARCCSPAWCCSSRDRRWPRPRRTCRS